MRDFSVGVFSCALFCLSVLPFSANAGTFSGTSIFLDTITENGTTAQTIVDYNGASRTTGSFYSDVITGSPSLSASSATIIEPRLTASVQTGLGAAQEADAFLFLPTIKRPSTGTIGPTYSGVAIAATRDDGGTTQYGNAASLRIESNPGSSVSPNQTWSLSVDAGPSRFGNSIFMFNANTGLHMATGSSATDLAISNDDAGASSISLFTAGARRAQLTSTTLTEFVDHTMNSSAPTLRFQGTESGAITWAIRENGGVLQFINLTAVANRWFIDADGGFYGAGVAGGGKGFSTINIAGPFYVGGVAGVTCSGTPSANFATVGGIVTHC